MKINLAKSAGFCFGVKRALSIACATAKANRKVYILGDLVHNEDVVRHIKKIGIKKINKLTKGKNRLLLIRAHGASLKTLERARRLGYDIIDATCPMVKEIHRIVKDMAEKDYKILVIGDKRHDEVQGIVGQLKTKSIVIDGIRNIPLETIGRIPKACIVVQSTQNLEKVQKIVKIIKGYIPQLKFFNTICKPTTTKQQEIRSMPLNNDVMIIIGSKNSANTKRLFEISKSLNKRSHWINSRREIRSEWFRNADNVGVTAGASTPQSIIQDIINYISLINHQGRAVSK